MARRTSSTTSVRRTAPRLALALLVVVATALGTGVGGSASAQGRGGTPGVFTSCGIGQLTSNQLWTQADVVFSAHPVTSETGSSNASGVETTLSRVVVAEVFKGLVSAEVVVAFPGRSCTRGTTDVIMAATRGDDGTYRLLGTVTREQADAFGGKLPPVNGTAPVRALAAVDGGPVDLVALDGDGAVLGYRAGSSPPALLARCPEGRLAVAFQGLASDAPAARRIEVIDLATMTTQRRLPWRTPTVPSGLACGSADGGQVSAFVPSTAEVPVDPFGSDQTGGTGTSGTGTSGTGTGETGEVGGSGPDAPPPPVVPSMPDGGGGVVTDPDATVVLGPTTSVPRTPPSSRPPGATTTPSPTGTAAAPGTAGTGRLVRYQGQTPSQVSVALSAVVGVDDQGRFLGWSDALTTSLATVDPADGTFAHTVTLPAGLHAQLTAVSDDGRRAVVLASDQSSPTGALTPVLIDLTTAAPLQTLPPRPSASGTVDRLGFVGDDVVIVGTDPTTPQNVTTVVLGTDGTVKSSTSRPRGRSSTPARVLPPGVPADPYGGTGVTDPGLRVGSDDVPRLFGVPVGATLFLPASPPVALDPSAAKPAIVATQRLNDGRPLELDRTPEDRVTIAVSVVTAMLLLFMFGGLWRYRAPRVAT